MKVFTPRTGCVFIAVLLLLTACESNKRYEILSFFFDGVPRPEGKQSTDQPGEAESGDEREKKKFYQHGPYGARLCSSCHDKRTNRLILPKEELCLFCHILPENYSRLHGPLAAGGCTVCHNPHGTFNRALLVADARDFCLYCHDREDVMKRDVHRNADKTCTACHDAHGGDNNFLLKTLSRENNRTVGQKA